MAPSTRQSQNMAQIVEYIPGKSLLSTTHHSYDGRLAFQGHVALLSFSVFAAAQGSTLLHRHQCSQHASANIVAKLYFRPALPCLLHPASHTRHPVPLPRGASASFSQEAKPTSCCGCDPARRQVEPTAAMLFYSRRYSSVQRFPP